MSVLLLLAVKSSSAKTGENGALLLQRVPRAVASNSTPLPGASASPERWWAGQPVGAIPPPTPTPTCPAGLPKHPVDPHHHACLPLFPAVYVYWTAPGFVVPEPGQSFSLCKGDTLVLWWGKIHVHNIWRMASWSCASPGKQLWPPPPMTGGLAGKVAFPIKHKKAGTFYYASKYNNQCKKVGEFQQQNFVPTSAQNCRRTAGRLAPLEPRVAPLRRPSASPLLTATCPCPPHCCAADHRIVITVKDCTQRRRNRRSLA